MNADSRIRGFHGFAEFAVFTDFAVFADFTGKPSKEHELRIVRRIVFRTIAVR